MRTARYQSDVGAITPSVCVINSVFANILRERTAGLEGKRPRHWSYHKTKQEVGIGQKDAAVNMEITKRPVASPQDGSNHYANRKEHLK